ncbi:helix-turn-helix transcriptional regulator [Virgibacillus kekensis]|uniref:Helix-turn-helix transcriptional regulator n=1 Tax=Virgibacillus kekensis TaxID=202261 RepID=A0ABV9DJK3_9BACI
MILAHENGLFLRRDDLLGERNWRNDGCYKMIYSPLGTGKYQTKSQDVEIAAGNFLILNPLEEHRQLQATKEKFLVEVEQSLLSDVAEQLNIKVKQPEFVLMPHKNHHIVQWLSFTRNYIADFPNEMFMENNLVQLAILMLENGPGSHSEELSVVTENLVRVTDALRENYSEDWSLEQMASLAGLSKYRFAHVFKGETGLSPYSWLQLYRLIKSQQLLMRTKASVLSIALNAGFKSISSYNHLFKKVYGKTPTEFRSFYQKNS